MMNDHERMEVDVSEWLSLTQLRGGTLSYTEESWCVHIYIYIVITTITKKLWRLVNHYNTIEN